MRASTNRWSHSASVSYDVQNVMDPPAAGTAISRVSLLYETSPICEYTYWVPVCGSNGPPGLAYRAAAQLSNCSNWAVGRMPLVARNDDLRKVLPAKMGSSRPHARPVNGSSTPIESNAAPPS